jgi:hypothetical protein
MSAWLEKARAAMTCENETRSPVRLVPLVRLAPNPEPNRANRANRTGTEGGDTFAERAAVIEEGAKVPRDWAEAFARLQAMPAPAGVDAADWTAALNGAGRFLDRWGAQAAALGWTAEEVFRFDPTSLGAAHFLARANVTEVGHKAIAFRIGPNVWRLCRRENFA